MPKMSRGRHQGIDQHPDMVRDLLKTGWELDPVGGEPAPLPEPIREEMAKPEVEIPDGIETAHHFTKIKLAKQLDPEFMGDSKQAMELIDKTKAARQS